MATKQREFALDGTNIRLLQELQADARVSNAELGRRVGLSAPAVADRLARLEESGAIVTYGAELDPRALGYSLSVVLRIRPAPRELGKVAELARRTHEIVECHRPCRAAACRSRTATSTERAARGRGS